LLGKSLDARLGPEPNTSRPPAPNAPVRSSGKNHWKEAAMPTAIELPDDLNKSLLAMKDVVEGNRGVGLLNG
jgi:hypothetical protein